MTNWSASLCGTGIKSENSNEMLSMAPGTDSPLSCSSLFLTGIQLLKACQWAIPLKLRETHSTTNAKKEASEDFTNNRLKTDLHQRPLQWCNRVDTFACVCTCMGLLTFHRVFGPNSSSRLSLQRNAFWEICASRVFVPQKGWLVFNCKFKAAAKSETSKTHHL